MFLMFLKMRGYQRAPPLFYRIGVCVYIARDHIQRAMSCKHLYIAHRATRAYPVVTQGHNIWCGWLNRHSRASQAMSNNFQFRVDEAGTIYMVRLGDNRHGRNQRNSCILVKDARWAPPRLSPAHSTAADGSCGPPARIVQARRARRPGAVRILFPRS